VRAPASFAQRVVGRYTKLDEELQEIQRSLSLPSTDASLDAASTGSGQSSRASGYSVADKETLREVAAYGPLVAQLADGCLAFDDREFVEHLPWLYPLLVDLSCCGDASIRAMMHAVFMDRIRLLLPGPVASPESPLRWDGTDRD
jgi:hypothetical protein